jgi:hypothetical protein
MGRVIHNVWNVPDADVTRLYKQWKMMVARCHQPRTSGYAQYGGQGIAVCPEWREFPAYAAWAFSHGYAANRNIDRRNVFEGYSPENCRWVARGEQISLSHASFLLTVWGETKTAFQWAQDARCKVTANTLYQRVKRLNWAPERALLTNRGGKNESC